MPHSLQIQENDKSKGVVVSMVSQASTGLQAVRPKKSCLDVFHAFMTAGCEFDSLYEVPLIKPVDAIPGHLISFSEAVRLGEPVDEGTWVHFYEHDQRIERFWNNPRRYHPILKRFSGVIAPDYSLYRDMPEPQKRWNSYRNYLCAAWLQNLEMLVIPNIRLWGLSSIGYALAGAPKNGVIAVGMHGNIRDRYHRARITEEVDAVVECLRPKAIVVYGSGASRYAKSIFDYPVSLDIPVIWFSPRIAVAHGCDDNG